MKPGKSVIQIIIVVFPLILIGMVIMGVVLYEQRRLDKVEEHPMSQQITTSGLIQQYSKLRDFMSPRGFANEKDQQRLLMTTAFIDGSISTINTGMIVSHEQALTEVGRIWKKYSIQFGEDGVSQSLHINYREASNAELAIAISIAEALPRQSLNSPLTISFGPEGDTSFIAEWVTEARARGENSNLSHDGIDWQYLLQKVEEYIDSL